MPGRRHVKFRMIGFDCQNDHTRTHAHTHTHTHTHARTHARTHACTHTHIKLTNDARLDAPKTKTTVGLWDVGIHEPKATV